MSGYGEFNEKIANNMLNEARMRVCLDKAHSLVQKSRLRFVVCCCP